MSGTTILPNTYRPAPAVGITSSLASSSSQQADVDDYANAASQLLQQIRNLRTRTALPIHARTLDSPLIPDELNPNSDIVTKLSTLINMYRARCTVPLWRLTTLTFGDNLCYIGQYHLATEYCYKVCLLTPEPAMDEKITDIESFGSHCRAVIGIASASASLAKLRDSQCTRMGTVSQIILVLQRIQNIMALIISARPMYVREQLYYLVYNATITILTLAEPLITFSPVYASKVVPYLSYAVLAVESTPNLATPTHLPLRVRLYGTICRAYERMGMIPLLASSSSVPASTPAPNKKDAKGSTGTTDTSVNDTALPAPDDESIIQSGGAIGLNIYSARKALARALRGIHALRRMYVADPPLLETTVSALDQATLELYIRRFRYDIYLSTTAASAVLTRDVPSLSARIVALVSALAWGHTETRRILRHSPPGFETKALISKANTYVPDGLLTGITPSITSESTATAEAKRVNECIQLILKELKYVLEQSPVILRAFLPLAAERSTKGFLRAFNESNSNSTARQTTGVPKSALKSSTTSSAIDIMGLSSTLYEQVVAFEEHTAGGQAFPLHIHVALLRALYSYEAWTEFSYLLHVAEARYEVLLKRLLSTASDGNEIHDLSILGHEILLLRRYYELEFGTIPASVDFTASKPSNDTDAATAATKGGKTPANATSPPAKGKVPEKAEEKKSESPSHDDESSTGNIPSTISPLGIALSIQDSTSVPLPAVKVTPVQLSCAAEALLACVRTETRLRAQDNSSSVILTGPQGGGDVAVTSIDLVRDAIVILTDYVNALIAWRDNTDIGTERNGTMKTMVADVLFIVLRALHNACCRVPFDDNLLRGTISLRFASLCAERNDLVQALQVVRSALNHVQAERDRQLSLPQHLPVYASGDAASHGDDDTTVPTVTDMEIINLAHASITTTTPPSSLVEALKEHEEVHRMGDATIVVSTRTLADKKNALAQTFGAGSMVWTLQASLASLHADLISLWCLLELRYAAWESQQSTIVNMKRKKIATAKANEAAARKRPVGKLLRKLGQRSSSSSSSSAKSDTEDEPDANTVPAASKIKDSNTAAEPDDYIQYLQEVVQAQGPRFRGWAPSAVAEARLLSECGHNAAWRAMAHLAMVHWRYDAASRLETLNKAVEQLDLAMHQEKSMLRTVVGGIRSLYGQRTDGSLIIRGTTDEHSSLSTINGGKLNAGHSLNPGTVGHHNYFVDEEDKLHPPYPHSQNNRSRSTSPDHRNHTAGTFATTGKDLTVAKPPLPNKANDTIMVPGLGSTTVAHKVGDRTIYIDPKTGLAKELASAKNYRAPFILCRNSSSITIAPATYPGSENRNPLPSARGKPLAPVTHYITYGKAFGSGTDVSESSTELVGTGIPIHLSPSGGASALNDCWASSSDSMGINAYAIRTLPLPDSHGQPVLEGEANLNGYISASLNCTVSSLLPNEVYHFATGAITGVGSLAGGHISASTAAVLAATPLPLHLLWSYIAVEAHRIGELQVARSCALKVVKDFVSMGPVRPFWSDRPNPAAIYVLRRDVMKLAPRPVVACLARALCVLADTGEAGMPPSRFASQGPQRSPVGEEMGTGFDSIVPSPSIYDADGWSFDAFIDGRAPEGPGAADEQASVNSLPYGARLQMATLQRVGTLGVAVEVAVALRDPALIQFTVCSCFAAMLPVLAAAVTRPHPHLLQPLLLCQQALSVIPRIALTTNAMKVSARITYELTLACLHAGPMLTPPGVVRDTVYARAVLARALAEQNGQDPHSVSAGINTIIPLSETTAHVAPVKNNQVFVPLRDYSPWIVETATPGLENYQLLPPSAVASSYGIFADTYANIASNIVEGAANPENPSLPFGYGANVTESERTALAHFLLWSPRWAEQVDAMGVSLSNSPPSTTGLTNINIDTLLNVIGAVSGLTMAARNPPKGTADSVSLALAYVHRVEAERLRMMAEVWAVARTDPLAAVDLVLKKYSLGPAGNATNATPAPAPAPAKDAKGGKGGAPVSTPVAVPIPSFNPLLVQLLCRIVGTSLTTQIYNTGANRPGTSTGAPSTDNNTANLKASFISIDALLDKISNYIGSSSGSVSQEPEDTMSIRTRIGQIFNAAKVEGLKSIASENTAAFEGIASPLPGLAYLLAAIRPVLAVALLPTATDSANPSEKEKLIRSRAATFLAEVLSLGRTDKDNESNEDDIFDQQNTSFGSTLPASPVPLRSSSVTNDPSSNIASPTISWQLLRQADSGNIPAAIRLPLLWISHIDLLRTKTLYMRLLTVAQIQSAIETGSLTASNDPAGSTASVPSSSASKQPTMAWRTVASNAASMTHRGLSAFDGSGPYSLYHHLCLLLESTEADTVPNDNMVARVIPQIAYTVNPSPLPLSSEALSSSIPLVRLVLSSASDAVVTGRAALAWSTVRDAARTAWASIGAAWAAPYLFGYVEGLVPSENEMINQLINSPRSIETSVTISSPNATVPVATTSSSGGESSSSDSESGSPSGRSKVKDTLWRSVPKEEIITLPSVSAALDWRPLWRISLCLFDMIDALAEGKLERLWGRGLPPEFRTNIPGGGAGPNNFDGDDGVDIASDDGIEPDNNDNNDPKSRPSRGGFGMNNDGTLDGPPTGTNNNQPTGGGGGGGGGGKATLTKRLGGGGGTNPSIPEGTITMGMTVTEDDTESVEAETIDPARMPSGITLDDITWMCRFIAYTALALLHAQEWAILSAFGQRIATAQHQVVLMLGGRDDISQSPNAATPDIGWSGVGGGLVNAPNLVPSEADHGGSATGGGKTNHINEPYGFTMYPGYFVDAARVRSSDLAYAVINPTRGHGAALCDDALGIGVRVGTYAARIRWTLAAQQLDVAQTHAENAAHAFATRPSLRTKVRHKRSTIAEHEALLKREEEEYSIVTNALAMRIDRLTALTHGRRAALRRLHEALANYMRDMAAPRKQLNRARSLLIKHIHYGTSSGTRITLPYSSQAVLPLDLVASSPHMFRKNMNGGNATNGLPDEELDTVHDISTAVSIVDGNGVGGSSVSAIRSLRFSTDTHHQQPGGKAKGNSSTLTTIANGTTSSVAVQHRSQGLIVSVPFHTAMGAYQTCILSLRKRRETALLCQALHELGNAHYAKAGIAMALGTETGTVTAASHLRGAFDAWKDGLDATFGVLDAYVNWRSSIASFASHHSSSASSSNTVESAMWQTMGTGLFERHGFAGSVIPAIFAVKLVTAAHAARALIPIAQSENSNHYSSTLASGISVSGLPGATLTQGQILDLYLLAAFTVSATFTASAILHPTRDVDFSRHRPTVWIPGVDIFADERLVSSSSLQFTLRSIITGLLEYGNAFAERALPIICAYEYVASVRLGDVRMIIDARLLRGRAQVAIGDLEGAVDTLSGILRADGFPHTGIAVPAVSLAAYPSAKTNSATNGGATTTPVNAAKPGTTPSAGTTNVPSENSLVFSTTHHAILPRFYNHLPPIHPVNRAAMSWIADPNVISIPSGLALFVGSVTIARVHLLRAEICRAILASSKCARAHIDFFGELGVGPDTEHPNSWYGALYKSSGSFMLNKHPKDVPTEGGSNPTGGSTSSSASAPYPVHSLYYGLTKEQTRWPMMQSSAAPVETKDAKGGKGTAPQPTTTDTGGSSAEDAAAVAGDAKWIDAFLRAARIHICNAIEEVENCSQAVKMEALGLSNILPSKTASPTTGGGGGGKPGTAAATTKPGTAGGTSHVLLSGSMQGGDTTDEDSFADQAGLLSIAINCATEAAYLANARGEHRIAASASAEAIRLMNMNATHILPSIDNSNGNNKNKNNRNNNNDLQNTLSSPVARAAAAVELAKRFFTASLEDTYIVRSTVPTWFGMRGITIASLMNVGAVGEAESICCIAVQEAKTVYDGVSTGRLLLLHAAAATLLGDTVGAFSYLEEIIIPAVKSSDNSLSNNTADHLTTLDTAAFTASRAYALFALPEAATVAKAINCLVTLERTMGNCSPRHVIQPRASPSTRYLKILASTSTSYVLTNEEAAADAGELRLLLLSERLIRQRLGALGVDVRRMDLAADGILRAEEGLGSLIDPAQPAFTLDSVYVPDMEVLGEVRDMIGDSLIAGAISSDTSLALAQNLRKSTTVTNASAALAAIAARKRAQQLVVCHHIAAVQPSMIICAALGIARSVRVWLASSAHTVSFAIQRQLIAAAELHSMIGFEVARILCEHDVNLLRFAAVELSLQYLATARLALREDDRPLTFTENETLLPGYIKTNEIQNNALRYAIIMHRLAGRLGVIAQRALAGKPAEFVARQVGASSGGGATGGKDAGKGGRPPTSAVAPNSGNSLATPDDEKLRSVLPPSLFDDLQAYRKASALSATAVMQAATNDPKTEGKVTAPTPTAVILFSHMSALYSMMRAWPSVGGPIAASVEDAAQSLHSSLCSLLPIYRSAWGLSRPLHARLQSARAQPISTSDPTTNVASTPASGRKGSTVSTSTGQPVIPRLLVKATPYGMPTNARILRISYGPGEMTITNTMIQSFIGVSSSIITRNDEELTDGSTALLSLLLGPTSMDDASNTSTGGTSAPPPSSAPTGSSKSKPSTATSVVPPVETTPASPKKDNANTDVLVLRLDIPAHDLLGIREAFADLRQRYRQLLDPAALSAAQLLNPSSNSSNPTPTSTDLITVPGTKPLDSVTEANETLISLCDRFGQILRTSLDSLNHNVTGTLPSLEEIIQQYQSSKGNTTPTNAVPTGKDAKGKDAPVASNPEKDAGDESDDEYIVPSSSANSSTTPTSATTTTPVEKINPQLAVRIVDTFCRLLDHRFGGSSRQGVVNQWIRATVGFAASQ